MRRIASKTTDMLIPRLFAGMNAAPCEDAMNRVALGIVYCATRHAILMLERADFACGVRWAFPGGKIDGDENPKSAAIREVREETGVLIKCASHITFREHPITKAAIHYYLLECREAAQARNTETAKHLSVGWWRPERVVEQFGAELAPPVLERLKALSSPSARRLHKAPLAGDADQVPADFTFAWSDEGAATA